MEVWISESQERMIYDVRPADVRPILELFGTYDVPATEIGEVVPGPYETIEWNGRTAGRLSLAFRIDPPAPRRARRARARPRRPSPRVPDGAIPSLFEGQVLAPDSVSREPVIRVYDHEIGGRTVVKPLHGNVGSPSHGDAAVIGPRPRGRSGLAIATATQPWACRDDPVGGARWVVEEAARNLYAVGARPDAFTNCLNFGNPEDPRVMDDFAKVTRGLGEAAEALGFAVPSGNVSFYNGGLGAEIPPTPVLLATGIVPDLRAALTSDLKRAGDALYLLGQTGPEVGGSLWARRNGIDGVPIARSDPAALRRLGDRFLRAVLARTVVAAHDVSDGGLAVTLAEMAFGGGIGFDVDLGATRVPGPGLALVAEGASRLVVEVPERSRRAFERGMRGLPLADLGTVVDEGGTLRWGERRLASVDLRALYPRWRDGLGIP